MLGLLLLYWIGKYFYKLAEQYNKHQWGYTILGIAVYYGGMFLCSFLAGVILEVYSPGYIDGINETLFGVFMIPFGLLSCYLLYLFLEKNWKKTASDLAQRINEISVSE